MTKAWNFTKNKFRQTGFNNLIIVEHFPNKYSGERHRKDIFDNDLLMVRQLTGIKIQIDRVDENDYCHLL